MDTSRRRARIARTVHCNPEQSSEAFLEAPARSARSLYKLHHALARRPLIARAVSARSRAVQRGPPGAPQQQVLSLRSAHRAHGVERSSAAISEAFVSTPMATLNPKVPLRMMQVSVPQGGRRVHCDSFFFNESFTKLRLSKAGVTN